MDEVRSYWQVASISHFCTIFGKPFKLPTFEPEELEQAFILDLPAPPKSNTNHIEETNGLDHNINNNNNSDNISSNNNNNNIDHSDQEQRSQQNSPVPSSSSPPPPTSSSAQTNSYNGWSAATQIGRDLQNSTPSQQQQEEPQQQEQHLLVKLAIALLKPHFNTKISQANWENYLRRLVDANWVDLEHHPSPFFIPLITQDGVELTKNLTFNELSLSDKIDLFYALCDYRLWCEDAAEAIKDYPLEELRLESIGKDSQGYEYWYFSGTRLFRENKELSQDIILRKKRIKELEYNLIELEKTRILREQEEKRKAELERTRQLAAEAREARIAAKRQQEQEAQSKKRKNATPILPPRTGLRERRSSATSNNNHSQQQKNQPLETTRTPTTRSKQQQAKQQPDEQPHQQTKSTQKVGKGPARNSRHNDQVDSQSNESTKLSPEEDCKAELERLTITQEDRAEAWLMCCDSLEDWESFAVKFVKSKSTNEKYLSSYVNEELLPKIRAIYAKRAAEIRRKEKELLLSLSSRRVSTRIISKRTQEEEEERQAQLHEAEMRRKKVEAETRLRAELEREMRVRQNRFVINGGNSSTCSEDGEDLNGRYNLRQSNNTNGNEFDGIIHPDNLSEFYEAIELVIDTVRTSKHAWPFVDPVPETVPGYYDLIKNPMDLRKLRTKIEFREYKSLIELEKDFQLLINNCENFNGPKNVYTKMVYKLWKSFKKNVRLYLEKDLFMDEYETFVYPPVPKKETQPQVKLEQESKHKQEVELNQEVELEQEIELEQVNLDQEVEMLHEDELTPPTPSPIVPSNSPTPSIKDSGEVAMEVTDPPHQELSDHIISTNAPITNHQEQRLDHQEVESSAIQQEENTSTAVPELEIECIIQPEVEDTVPEIVTELEIDSTLKEDPAELKPLLSPREELPPEPELELEL